MKKISLLFGLMFIIYCGASVNPQLKAKVDRQFAQSGQTTYSGTQKFMKPKPYAVGQYVVMGQTDSDGKKSITRMAIVGKQQGGWIFENYTVSENQEGIMQMLIVGLEKVATTGNIDDLDIIWVKIKDENGQVQTIEGPMLSMMKGLYKKGLASVSMKINIYKDGGVIQVPAGIFKGTNVVETETTIIGKKTKTTGWYHYSVPINGIVKVVDNDGNTLVLLQFGFDAKPMMK
ncbi:MAG: hypothetical protein QHH74_01430 [Spirochaetota bacterium]|nr:hypothetical protein [Spirochaetota bacterium]